MQDRLCIADGPFGKRPNSGALAGMQALSGSSRPPIQRAQDLWARLQPGARTWPRALDHGRSIECYVPDSPWRVLRVRLKRSDGAHRGMCIQIWRGDITSRTGAVQNRLRGAEAG